MEGDVMTELRFVRSHVERCLQDEWELCRVTQDPDGDYPFRQGPAACWVQVCAGDPVLIKVFGVAATGIRRTTKLLTELNEINNRAGTTHVVWTGGTVLVQQTLLAEGVDRVTLGHACTAVGSLAADIGPLTAAMFGGATPFPVGDEQREEGAME
jgi:hypothetical protein